MRFPIMGWMAINHIPCLDRGILLIGVFYKPKTWGCVLVSRAFCKQKQGHAAVSGAGGFGSWLAAISERNKHDFTNIDN